MRISRRNASIFGSTGLVVYLAAMLLNVTVSRATSAGAQQDGAWIAPSQAKNLKNPERATPGGLKGAGELFQEKCASCHGAKGAGDGVLSKALTPRPADFTDARRMKRETDGALYWKMTNGRGPMPSWQQIPEKQRWQLVNYLRTLAARGNLPGNKNSVAE
jgi:mono/diheme cytochrome c family protein